MLLQYIKRGAYNTLFYGASTAFVRAISFIFLPFFLSRLTITEFGVWDFYQTFFSLGTLVLSSCASTALFRFYFLYKDDVKKQQQVVGNALLIPLIGLLFFVPLALATVLFLGICKGITDYGCITIMSVGFFSLFSMVVAYVRVLERVWWYMFFFCTQSLLASFLTLLGVHNGYGIEIFFYANSVSFLIFVPCYFYLLKNHLSFSLPLLKEQLRYSVPLLFYSLLYTGFFTIDRLLLKGYSGYDALGIYSLLWRFGGIFQFLAIALGDAWPIVLFNAHKEENGDYLISKLMVYFCVTITSFCLLAIVVARCAIGMFFPVKYYVLIDYLPAFFLPIIFLEIARIFQAGFGLSTNTVATPVLAATALCVQVVLIIALRDFGLWGLFCANAIAFLIYAMMSYHVSRKVYAGNIINVQKIGVLMSSFTCFILVYQWLFYCAVPWTYLCAVFCCWPVVLWLNGTVAQEEKLWLYANVYKVIALMKKRTLQ